MLTLQHLHAILATQREFYYNSWKSKNIYLLGYLNDLYHLHRLTLQVRL